MYYDSNFIQYDRGEGTAVHPSRFPKGSKPYIVFC